VWLARRVGFGRIDRFGRIDTFTGAAREQSIATQKARKRLGE
jgi:hypothetical protein